jgi:hypothetical protein
MELRQRVPLPTRAREIVKLAIERRGEQLGRWTQMTEALAQESGKVEPAVHQENAASNSVMLAIQVIADTSRTLAAAEATVATQLASRGWDEERMA